MKKTTSIIAIATLCLFFSAATQSQTVNVPYKPIKIGDIIPDMTLTNIYNYKTDKVKLTDFKAKLIILDFWATWCVSCLVNFPKIEELQKQYDGKVQFIKVTYQPKAEVLPFLEKFHKDKPSEIPVITDDKVLHELFPHVYIPHYVWIDQSGKVIAATNGRQLTKENIDSFLSNGDVGNMRIKVDMDDSEPLFITNDLLKNNELKHYSVFLKGIYDGLGSGVNNKLNKEGKQTGLTITNTSLLRIYEIIVSVLFQQRGQRYFSTRSKILVKDISLIKYTKDRFERISNSHTYACNATDLDSSSLYQYIFDDLNRYSDYRGSIEKMKVKCLVLKRTSKIDKIKSKGGLSKSLEFGNPCSKMVNYPLIVMLLRMSELSFIKLPIIDETGYKGAVDLQISKYADLSDLQKELKKYDLELKEQTRELDTFVLRDKN